MRLEFLRRHQQWMLWLLVVLTVIVFGLFGTGQAIQDIIQGTGAGAQAYYRGKPISASEYNTFRGRWIRLFRRSDIDADQLHQYLLTQMIMLKEARAAGMRVTNGEVVGRLRQMVRNFSRRDREREPAWQDDEAFDHDAYANLLRMYDMGEASFEETIREQLLIEKYEKAMMDVIRSSDFENWLEFEKQNTKVRARYLTFRSDEFSEMVEPSEEEVRDYFEQNNREDQGLSSLEAKTPGKYFQPNRVAIEYAYVPFESVARELGGTMKVSFDEIEQHYRKNRSKFKNAEEDVKSGKPRYKSLGEVYDEVVKEVRENEARRLAHERLRKLDYAWHDKASKDTPDETLDTLMEALCTKHKALYHGRTALFSPDEIDRLRIGPIAGVKRLAEQAFRVYEGSKGQKPVTTTEARHRLSETMIGDDGCYALRIVSKKPAYSPTWTELGTGRVPGLTIEKVKDDLKVANGFAHAQEQARKFRTAIYDHALGRLAEELGSPAKVLEVSEAGELPDLGAAEDAVTEMALKTEVGQVSRPFEAAGKLFLLLVTEGTESKRTVKLVGLDQAPVEKYELEPSAVLLEFFYEQVKTRKAYQAADRVEAEYVLAKAETFAAGLKPTDDEVKQYYEDHQGAYQDEGGKPRALDDVKAQIVSAIKEAGAYGKAKEALEKALDDDLLKSDDDPSEPGRKSSADQEAIEDLADKLKLKYVKDLDAFQYDDAPKRAEALGRALAYAEGIEELLADLKEEQWSEMRDSEAGPFIIRVVERKPSGPAPFDEVKEQLGRDFRAAWKNRKPDDRLLAVWGDQLQASLSDVSALQPIPKKTRKVFRARPSGFFVRGSAPLQFSEESGVAKALEKLKPGELSDPILDDDRYVVALVTGEREEKKVKITYGEVPPVDFQPREADVKEDDLRKYHKRHADQFRSPTEVEIEYVLADLLALEKEAEGKITDEEVRDYYGRHRLDYYKDLTFEQAQPLAKRDLPRERAAEEAKKAVDSAFGSALKSRKRGTLNLQQTAENHKLKYAAVKFSRAEAGSARLANLGSRDKIPARAFQMKDGEMAGPFRTATSCFFFHRVRSIDSAPYSFEDARDKVLNSYRTDVADDRARAWVASVVEKAKTLPLKDAIAAVPYPEGENAPSLEESDFFSNYSPGESVPSSEVRDAAVKLAKGDVVGPIESRAKVYFAKIIEEQAEQQMSVIAATFRVDSFEPPEFKVTEAELAARYEAEKETFRRPDQCRVEYLFVSMSDLMGSEKVKALATEEALKEFYEANKDEYWKDPKSSTPEKTVHLPLSDVIKAEVSFFIRQKGAEKLAGELIQQAREKVKSSDGPADLAQLAEELGLRHGQTELFAKERPGDPAAVWKDLEQVDALAEIAFGMKDGEVLADERLVVGGGRALIRRSETRESHVPALPEVRDEVLAKVVRQKAVETTRKHVEAVHESLKKGLAEQAEDADGASIFISVVREATHLADSVVRPVDRETEYFDRPRMGPRGYWGYVGGLSSASGKYDVQAQFALAAFGLPRAAISDPVVAPGDETECYLITVSGTQWPSQEKFEQGGRLAGGYGDWEKRRAASQTWVEVVQRLQGPRR